MTTRPWLDRARTERARVERNGRLTSEVFRCVLAMPPEWPVPLPGQFVQLDCLPGREFSLRRPFSVSRVHQHSGGVDIELVYSVVGDGTARLASLEPGESIDVLGPLGNAFRPVDGRSPVLVGGGRGIAPMVCLADQLSKSYPSGRILYGARDAGTLVPLEDAAYPVEVATDDGSSGFCGSVLGLLDRLVDDGEIHPEASAIFSCGPNAMLHALSDWAKRREVPVQVSLETIFGCGFGICAGCAVPVLHDEESREGEFGRYRFACVDGPVFDGARVDWPEVRE